MSISGALSNAVSGLSASALMAQTTSSNIANALTPDYAARESALAARSGGTSGGVMVAGVSRRVDQWALSEQRLAASAQGEAQTLAAGLGRLEGLLGLPGSAGSLGEQLDKFAGSLVSAVSRPDQPGRLTGVVRAAGGVAGKLAQVSNGIQAVRMEAERSISAGVEQLNIGLANISRLNASIARASITGGDQASLMDQRQQQIQALSHLIPMREVARPHGQVALISRGGAILLDGKPAELSFAQANQITPHTTRAGGHLSGLEINGVSIALDAETSPVRGGALLAQFSLRDDHAVAAQAGVDALAREIAARFQDTALDPTLAPGAPGLFADGTGAVLPANEVGLAQRLRVNPLVDPSQPSQHWRVRDGLGAASPGPAGNAGLLAAMQDALEDPRVPVSAASAGVSQSIADRADGLLDRFGVAHFQSENKLAAASARHEAVTSRILEGGVDTDAQMQKLLAIEQAYAANARMIQAVDEMLEQLLRI